jgi:hypothetical protein
MAQSSRNSMINFIGIDLGKKGAATVCKVLPIGKPSIEIYPFYCHHNEESAMRTITEEELYLLFQKICYGAQVFCTIEHPVFMPLNGKKAIASLHENFGLVKGMMIGLGVTNFWLPKPVTWKKVIDAHGNDKSVMYTKARKFTKHLKLNTDTADSALICMAGKKYFS